MKYVFLILTVVCVLCCGCSPTNQKQLNESQPEVQSKPDPNIATISGVIENVEYYLSHGEGITIVRFQDGRIKAFCKISLATFYRNKQNLIEYDVRTCMILSVRTPEQAKKEEKGRK